MKSAIVNTTVILPEYMIPDGYILIEDDIIAGYGRMKELSVEGIEIFDAQGQYTGPGLVDIHAHAGACVEFDDDPYLADLEVCGIPSRCP